MIMIIMIVIMIMIIMIIIMQNRVFTTRWRPSLTSKSRRGFCSLARWRKEGTNPAVPSSSQWWSCEHQWAAGWLWWTSYLDFSFHDSQQLQQLLLGQRCTHASFLVLLLLRSSDPLLHEPWLVLALIWTFHGAVSGTHFLSSVKTDQRHQHPFIILSTPAPPDP